MIKRESILRLGLEKIRSIIVIDQKGKNTEVVIRKDSHSIDDQRGMNTNVVVSDELHSGVVDQKLKYTLMPCFRSVQQ